MDRERFPVRDQRRRWFSTHPEDDRRLTAGPRSGKGEGHSFMLHVTCDLCGKGLCPGEDARYVVKIEVFAAHDPAKITEADLDDDHLEAISQLLRDQDSGLEDPDLAEPVYKHFRYDLCPECHKRFLRDPLGKDMIQKFDFSKN
jgi:hypothetical protein